MSDDESSVETTAVESAYETEDDSSPNEEDTGEDDSDEDEYDYTSEGYECSSVVTDDSDDSTFIEDTGIVSDSDGDTTYSLVDDDIRTLVEDFHGLMKEVLARNSTLCLIQFRVEQARWQGK